MSSGNECCFEVNKLTALLSQTGVEERNGTEKEEQTELSFASRGMKLDKAEDG